MTILCQAKIQSPDEPRLVTYCMRPMGHPKGEKDEGHSMVPLTTDNMEAEPRERKVPRL